jgi:hypothetical protein
LRRLIGEARLPLFSWKPILYREAGLSGISLVSQKAQVSRTGTSLVVLSPGGVAAQLSDLILLPRISFRVILDRKSCFQERLQVRVSFLEDSIHPFDALRELGSGLWTWFLDLGLIIHLSRQLTSPWLRLEDCGCHALASGKLYLSSFSHDLAPSASGVYAVSSSSAFYMAMARYVSKASSSFSMGTCSNLSCSVGWRVMQFIVFVHNDV